jgi:argininosuccinate lyase
MQLCFQVAFREAHHFAGEVVTLSEKQNVEMSSLSLQQLQSIRQVINSCTQLPARAESFLSR